MKPLIQVAYLPAAVPLLTKTAPHRRYFRWILLLVFGLGSFTFTQAQHTDANTVTVEANFRPIIIDENQEPIPGVLLSNLSTGATATSDEGGAANLAAKEGDKVTLSLFGTIIQEYIVGSNHKPQIILSSKNPAVQRQKPVRLLYNISSKPELTATSTQAVYNNDIQKIPATSFVSTLPGRLAGAYTFQSLGQPGADGTTLNLRGQDPLVVIDGIPRQLTVFDLEEIESVTLLKDALSTAMLGVRGSDGVLLVTTRKGTPSRQRISFTAQSATQEPLRFAQTVNAYNYALLHNEASRNDGLAPVYTDADLQGYQSGSDPYKYPDVNWRDQVLKPSSRFDRYTFSASGGNNFSKYFVSLDHVNQTGLLKESDINAYSTNNSFKAYTVRSNIDLQLNSKISGGIYALGRILTGNDAGTGTNSIFAGVLTTPNNAYPIFNPNNSFGGNQQFQNNLWAQAIGSGYQQNFKRDMLADFYLKGKLDDMVEGLWIKLTGSYFATVSENINRSKTFAVFQRNLSPTGQATYTQYGVNGTQANGNGIEYQGRSEYVEVSLGYDRSFGDQGINAVLLGNRQRYINGSDLPYTLTGTAGRFAYNIKEKYVLEASFGLNGSNRYPPAGSTLYGFFPAVGAAWNVNKEAFLQNQNWLSYLKVFGSFGKTGNDDPGYFSYIQRYFDSPSAVFGTSAATNTSITEQPLANPNIRFEQANKLNLGIQGSLFKERLGFSAEYYNMKFYDLLMQRGRNSAILGNTYPNENIGQNRYQGLDLNLSWQQSGKDFSYYVALNAGLLQSEVLFIDEVNQPYPWMRRTGQRVGRPFGYLATGLFQSTAEIQEYPTLTGHAPQPGDIKYEDLNQDGVIDQFDQAPIGNNQSPTALGASLGFRWKGFDFSALLQGMVNRTIYLQGPANWAFQNNGFGQAFVQHLDRWTPANQDATYPRVWLGTNINNQATSSYWMRSGNYLRLKNIELGYSLPQSWLSRVRLQSFRIFANGTNLLTFNQDKSIDPESFAGIYPIQRLVNVGLNLQF